MDEWSGDSDRAVSRGRTNGALVVVACNANQAVNGLGDAVSVDVECFRTVFVEPKSRVVNNLNSFLDT